MDLLKKLIAERNKLLSEAKAICDKAIAEDGRHFTDEERAEVKRLSDEAVVVAGKIAAAEKDAATIASVMALAGESKTAAAAAVKAGGNGGRRRAKSIGEQFVTSDEFNGWLKQVAPSGVIPSGARGLTSPAVEFKSIPGLFRFKDLVTGESDTSAGAFVETDYTGIYEPLGRDALTLRNMISVRTTTSDLVSFVRQTTQITEATTVAEANVTEYSGATGEVSGVKPEGASAWEEVTQAVEAIAVWIPATKRALADASQMRGLLNQELRDDIAEELESQLINGDGTGSNLTGVLNTPGILAQAWNTDILTTCRQAITTLLVTGRAIPSAWLMNPEDWETIDLEQDTTGAYHFGGPIRQGTRTLWGYPVVQNVQVPAGEAILGDWRKAVLWDRERVTIQVSDSHADFFIRNMLAILAEMRATFGLIRPSAFIVVDLLAAS